MLLLPDGYCGYLWLSRGKIWVFHNIVNSFIICNCSQKKRRVERTHQRSIYPAFNFCKEISSRIVKITASVVKNKPSWCVEATRNNLVLFMPWSFAGTRRSLFLFIYYCNDWRCYRLLSVVASPRLDVMFHTNKITKPLHALI